MLWTLAKAILYVNLLVLVLVAIRAYRSRPR
jgi:hypothetical protein